MNDAKYIGLDVLSGNDLGCSSGFHRAAADGIPPRDESSDHCCSLCTVCAEVCT
jgi:hypothetical protein